MHGLRHGGLRRVCRCIVHFAKHIDNLHLQSEINVPIRRGCSNHPQQGAEYAAAVCGNIARPQALLQFDVKINITGMFLH